MVKRKRTQWESKHQNCTKPARTGRKVFWLSFCDGTKPRGEQFLGACVVDVTAAEADAAEIDMLLRFPLAMPGNEWLAAAISKAHRLGCNPGGEVASMELPDDHPNLSRYAFGVLMDKATIESIDRALEQAH